MGRFFSMDNKFFTFMNKVADLCILNIICLVLRVHGTCGRPYSSEYPLHSLLYSDRYCRSIYYGYVLCDTEDGPE